MNLARSLNNEHVSLTPIWSEISRRPVITVVVEAYEADSFSDGSFKRKPDAGIIPEDRPATMLRTKVFANILEAHKHSSPVGFALQQGYPPFDAPGCTVGSALGASASSAAFGEAKQVPLP